MKIKVLYIEGCPNYRLGVEELNRVLKLEGVWEQVEEIMVSGPDSAEQSAFPGFADDSRRRSRCRARRAILS